LGLGSAQLVGTPEQVQIRSKGGTLISQNPEADLQQIAGFSLPIEPLRYWVLALPHPDHDYHVEADAEGRTLKLWQDGWQVEYLEYQGVLPKKMVAVKDDVTLRFFSDQWAFPAP
jgi:outer membrane lipoprotein LolB